MPTGWVKKQPSRPLPPDWPKRREHVLLRDGRRCQHVREDTGRRCLQWANEVDHVLERSEGGSDDESNLASKCEWHHKMKTAHHAGMKSQRARRKRERNYLPPHPGILR